MPTTHTLEIGVVILPDHETSHAAKELSDRVYTALYQHQLNVKKVLNTSHISLYHLAINANQLAEIETRVKTISQSFQPFGIEMDAHLTDTQQNIFWNAQKSKHAPAFIHLLNEVVEKLNPLRSKETHLKQIEDAYTNLPLEKRDLVDRYGVFFATPQTFNPHITLVYNSGIDRENTAGDFIKIAELIKPIKPESTYTFMANNIAIVQLGYAGNAEKVLKQFPLMHVSQTIN